MSEFYVGTDETGVQVVGHSGGQVHVSTYDGMESTTVSLSPVEAIRFGFHLAGLGANALRGQRPEVITKQRVRR